MEELKEGKIYTINWVDGDFETNCKYEREHRGFWIFIDEKQNKIICKPSSVRSIKEVIK